MQKTKFENAQQLSKDLLAGVEGTAYKARSYIKFITSTVTGRHIVSARLMLTQFYPAAGATCKKSPPIYARRVTTAVEFGTLEWSKQPASHIESQAVVSCSGLVAGSPQATSVDVAKILQHWADVPAENWGFKIMVDGDAEATAAAANTLRKFRSANYIAGYSDYEPHILVTYNRRPTIGAVTLAPAAQGGVLLSAATKFSATVADPDGEDVRLRIDVTDLVTKVVTPVYSAPVHTGQTASVNLPASLALVRGRKYRFGVRASDGVSLSHLADTDWWYQDLVYDALPSVAAVRGDGVSGNAALVPPAWYEADVADADSGQTISTEFTLKQGSTVLGTKTIDVVDTAAVNTVRWGDPPLGLTAGGTYTLSVRVANAGRTPLIWSAASTLPFTVNDVPTFTDFRVDGAPSPPATAWRSTPLLSARVTDDRVRAAGSASVELFDGDPEDGGRLLGGGPAVLDSGLVSWRVPPGLLGDGDTSWVRFTASDQHAATGSEAFEFGVRTEPAVIPAEGVSVSPVTGDPQSPGLLVSALDPVIGARVVGEAARLLLQVRFEEGADPWESAPVASGSVAQVQIPSGHLAWGAALSGEVRAVRASDPKVFGPWTAFTREIAAGPRAGGVTVTPHTGGDVTSDRPVLSAALSGAPRDLGATFTVTVGSRTLRSGWLPADRGQVSWQPPEALPAGAQFEWTVVPSYRLGGSGDQQSGQFTTAAELFAPAGLTVTPRSVAGLVASAHPIFSAWIGGPPGTPARVVFHIDGRDSDPIDALTGTRVEHRATADLSGQIAWAVTATVDGDSLTTAGPEVRIDVGAVCTPDQGGRR